jgi:hypothetical protein
MENIDLYVFLITAIAYVIGYICGRLDQENKNRHEKRYKYK